jgi:hypothetical protein
MAGTMKNAVIWDMTPCGSRKNHRFGRTYRFHQQRERIGELGTTLAVTSGTYRFHHQGGEHQRPRNNVNSN